jgi:O-antigen/teichoic acid export membrane protein
MLAGSRVFTMGLGALELSLVVRKLGIEQYGVLGLIIAYVTTVNQFFDVRVWETVIRYLSSFLNTDEYQKGVALLKICGLLDILTGILAFLFVFSTAPLASRFIGPSDAQMENFIKLYALFLLVSTLDGTTTGTLRALDRFSILAFTRIVQKSIQVLMIWIFLSLNAGIHGILISYIISGSIDAAAKIVFTIKNFPISLLSANTSIRTIRPYYREIFKLIMQTNIHAVLKMLNGGAEILLLGLLSGATQVGYYKLARQIIDMISRLIEPLYESIYPQIAVLWDEGNGQRFKKFITNASEIVLFIVLPAIGVLFVFGDDIVWLISGQQHPNIVPLINIMSIALAINYIFVWLHPLAITMGKAYMTNIGRLSQSFLWVIGSFALIPMYGAMGTASLYFVNTIIWVAIMINFVYRPALHTLQLAGERETISHYG